MTRLLLVRHGQSEWNAVGRWQGWADPALTELGNEQSRLATTAVGPVDAVVASDLRRALDTATILAEGLGAGPVVVEPRWRERDVGEWTGLTRAEIDQRWPGALATATPEPPGGESPARLVARVLAAVERLAGDYPGEVVLVVTHGGVIRGLERHLGVDPEPLPNLGGVWLQVEAGGMVAGSRLLLIDPGDVPVTVPRQL
ncbi:MAG: histidine phosphatase family protein [Acidimicrobiales bacterium]